MQTKRRTFSDAVTAPYPTTGAPTTWDDDDPTVRIVEEEMASLAEAAMSVDTVITRSS